MKYTRKKLEETYDATQDEFLFFWGHQPTKDGSISNSCFSQWWGASFTVNEKKYLTAEHWMMAQKALLFDDNEIFEEILSTELPKEVKKLGRLVKNFDPTIWNEKKYEIVLKGNIEKFSQNESLKNHLLSTNDKIIVEASPYDRIWGIGMSKGNTKCQDPKTWRGQNLLGFALMETRDIIIKN